MNADIASVAYAKSIYQLGKEKQLDIVGELTIFQECINQNNELETLLFSDLFTVIEKTEVVNSIINKLSISDTAKNVISFLLSEKRFDLFPLIFKDLIVLDDAAKGFMRGTIKGKDQKISENDEKILISFLKKELGKDIILDYQDDSNISAGYRVIIGDYQLDATLDNQLGKLREDILSL